MAALVAATDGETTHHLGVRLNVIILVYLLHFNICRYKILFLDVLFPLSVKKIIFVDADQVD